MCENNWTGIQRTWCFVDIIDVILINLFGTDTECSVRTVSSKKKLDVLKLQNSDEEFEVSVYVFNLGSTELCCSWQCGCHGVSHIWRCNAAIVVNFHTLWFSILRLWNVCNILKCNVSDRGFIVICCRIVSIMNQSSCLLEVRWLTNLHLIPMQLIWYVVAQFETRSF